MNLTLQTIITKAPEAAPAAVAPEPQIAAVQADKASSVEKHPVLEGYSEKIRKSVRLAFHQPEKLLALQNNEALNEDSDVNLKLEALLRAMKGETQDAQHSQVDPSEL